MFLSTSNHRALQGRPGNNTIIETHMIGVGEGKKLRMSKIYCASLQMFQISVCTDLWVTRFSCGGMRTFSCLKWRPAVVLRCSSEMLTSIWLMNSTLRVTRMNITSSGAWPSRKLPERRLHSPKTAARRGNYGWNGLKTLSLEAWDSCQEPKKSCDLWTKVNATGK